MASVNFKKAQKHANNDKGGWMSVTLQQFIDLIGSETEVLDKTVGAYLLDSTALISSILLHSWLLYTESKQLLKSVKKIQKLPHEIKELVPEKLQDLLKNSFPAGLRFEKLKGYRRPDIYTIHITGNYKISLEIEGTTAKLRCVGNHNAIDRTP
jgi:mRNA-degrading endonuclease RelE of RelBE toxin-antitoxin system